MFGQSHREGGTEDLKCLKIFILILAIGDSCEMQLIVTVKHAVNHDLPKSPDITVDFRFGLFLFPCIYLFPSELKGYLMYYKAPSSNFRHPTALGLQDHFAL